MLIPANMADFIRSSMNFPLPVSAQLLGWSSGVLQEITTNAKVNNAPGTITGTTSPGSPLSSGAGTNGLVSGMMGSSMANFVKTDVPYPFVSTQLSKFCVEIVNHIQTLGRVTFTPNTITGNCTNTGVSNGPLTNGAGTNGMLTSLDGMVLANAIHASVGYPGSTSTKLIQFCTAIVNYIMSNAQVTYATNSVTGDCPTGGGALIGGTGLNGTIL